MKYILTADIGTTALKTALYSQNGDFVAGCSREYAFVTPEPGQAELAAEVYTETLAAGISSLLSDTGIDPSDIEVIGFSTQGETMLLLDDENRPLRRAVLWCDTRATAEAAEIAEHFGQKEIREHTGQVGADPIWPGAKLLWIRKHEPKVFEKTARIVQLEGWFSLLLTGRAAGEDSILGSSVYFDIRTRTYWPQMMEYLGIREEQLPEIVLPGAIVGQVTAEGAERFGLAAGTKVSIGGIDLAVGAVGVGNIRPGNFSDVTGSALCTMAMTDHIILDPAGEMPCYCSAVPGLYMIHAYATGGMCLRWFRDVFFKEAEKEAEKESEAEEKNAAMTEAEGIEAEGTGEEGRDGGGLNAYDRMDLLAADCPPGAEGLLALPHLTGSGPPDLCPEMKGSLIGLTPAHGQKHIIRALMEGVAMILCRVLEATEGLGLTADRIVCLGGGAKSPVWCQIKADATGREIVTTDGYENAGCLGAAMLAGTAAGMFPSLEEAVDRLVREDRRYLPDPQNAAVYRDLRTHYNELMQCLLPVFRR